MRAAFAYFVMKMLAFDLVDQVWRRTGRREIELLPGVV
jgi:hypothetical protein